MTATPLTPMEATLTIVLLIDNHAPASGTPYWKLTPARKHAVKGELMEQLVTPELQAVLERWKYMLVPVDPACCELDDAALRTLIQAKLAAAEADLEDGLGFVPQLGDSGPYSVCAKLPTCGHVCDHHYELRNGGEPWTVTSSDGVRAKVMISLQWATPAPTAGHH